MLLLRALRVLVGDADVCPINPSLTEDRGGEKRREKSNCRVREIDGDVECKECVGDAAEGSAALN